jgi:hypothetical protein
MGIFHLPPMISRAAESGHFSWHGQMFPEHKEVVFSEIVIFFLSTFYFRI